MIVSKHLQLLLYCIRVSSPLIKPIRNSCDHNFFHITQLNTFLYPLEKIHFQMYLFILKIVLHLWPHFLQEITFAQTPIGEVLSSLAFVCLCVCVQGLSKNYTTLATKYNLFSFNRIAFSVLNRRQGKT
jgi:hypothetical protein